MSTPIRTALYGALTGDATLTALLATTTSVYHRRAPADAAFPAILFHKQAGTQVWTFSGHLQNDLWLVKAIDRASSASAAEAIAARIDTVLADAALTVTGSAHLYLRRDGDVEYGEDDGQEQYVHVGAMWRLITEPA